MDKVAKDLGKRIKFARQELEWSQQELADKMGVSQRTVSRWEVGTAIVSPSTLVRLAELLEKDITYFFLPLGMRNEPIPRRRSDDWDTYEKAASPKYESGRQADNQAAQKAA